MGGRGVPGDHLLTHAPPPPSLHTAAAHSSDRKAARLHPSQQLNTFSVPLAARAISATSPNEGAGGACGRDMSSRLHFVHKCDTYVSAHCTKMHRPVFFHPFKSLCCDEPSHSADTLCFIFCESSLLRTKPQLWHNKCIFWRTKPQKKCICGVCSHASHDSAQWSVHIFIIAKWVNAFVSCSHDSGQCTSLHLA